MLRPLMLLMNASIALLLTTGCASLPNLQTSKNILRDSNPPVHIVPTPFFAQNAKHCGPASLTMALRHATFASKVELPKVTDMTFTPGANGTFKSDMLGAARRLGFAPYPVTNFDHLIKALQANTPVVVFQDIGLGPVHYWHFAVLVGYDSTKEELFLHTGDRAYERVALKVFLYTWGRGGNWSFVFVTPDQIPPYSHSQEALENAMVLSDLDQHDLAVRLYHAIIARWPHLYEPYAGLAGEYESQGLPHKAIESLQSAIQKNSTHAGLYLNMAILYKKTNQPRSYAKMRAKALEFVSDQQRGDYERRLDESVK